MTVFWGDDLLETTQGLDIVGVRGIDQAVEMSLVNGITTISQRGRYFSILPWALGEFYSVHTEDGFDWDALIAFLRRVEFIVLCATVMHRDDNGGDAAGMLGADLHRDLIAQLRQGQAVPFPQDKGGAILNTYFGPCRAIGLLREGDNKLPYQLTPRGHDLFEVRRHAIDTTPIAKLLHQGTVITQGLARSAVRDFSLSALAASGEEAALLRTAVTEPWPEAGFKVQSHYERVNGTIGWIKGLLSAKPDTAYGLLLRNFRSCIAGNQVGSIEVAWTEYEYRRRCHFAVELFLAALTNGLSGYEEASPRQLVGLWAEDPDRSEALAALWPGCVASWSTPVREVLASIPETLFLDGPLPVREMNAIPPPDKALAAFAALSITGRQTQRLRSTGLIQRNALSAAEFMLAEIDTDPARPMSELLIRLLEEAASAHLRTTFRKMGEGQKCSLRLFPDGAALRSTGIGVSAGHSGDRLTNVLRILADAGVIERINGQYTVSTGASE